LKVLSEKTKKLMSNQRQDEDKMKTILGGKVIMLVTLGCTSGLEEKWEKLLNVKIERNKYFHLVATKLTVTITGRINYMMNILEFYLIIFNCVIRATRDTIIT